MRLDPRGCLARYLGQLGLERRAREFDAPALLAALHTGFPNRSPTTHELGPTNELLAGQEVGTLTYLVHDAVTAAG